MHLLTLLPGWQPGWSPGLAGAAGLAFQAHSTSALVAHEGADANGQRRLVQRFSRDWQEAIRWHLVWPSHACVKSCLAAHELRIETGGSRVQSSSHCHGLSSGDACLVTMVRNTGGGNDSCNLKHHHGCPHLDKQAAAHLLRDIAPFGAQRRLALVHPHPSLQPSAWHCSDPYCCPLPASPLIPLLMHAHHPPTLTMLAGLLWDHMPTSD